MFEDIEVGVGLQDHDRFVVVTVVVVNTVIMPIVQEVVSTVEFFTNIDFCWTVVAFRTSSPFGPGV